MLHLTDRAAITAALASDIDPALRDLLATRAAALVTDDYDLTDCTEFLIVEEGDTEADTVAAVGFSPLVDPIDGYRIGEPGFQPGWDWLVNHGHSLEVAFSFGADHATIMLIVTNEPTPSIKSMVHSLANFDLAHAVEPENRPNRLPPLL